MICSCAAVASAPPDAAAFQAVVDDPHFSAWLATCDAKSYSIADTTAPPAFEGEGDPFFWSTDDVSADLVASLKARNRTPIAVPRLRLPANMVLRPITRDDAPFTWMSAPGYAENRTRAAVSVARRNSPACAAAGYIALVRRDRDRWIMEGRGGEWVD